MQYHHHKQYSPIYNDSNSLYMMKHSLIMIFCQMASPVDMKVMQRYDGTLGVSEPT